MALLLVVVVSSAQIKSNPSCPQASTYNIFILNQELQYMIMKLSLHMKHRHGLCHFVTTNNPLPVERLGPLISDLGVCTYA